LDEGFAHISFEPSLPATGAGFLLIFITATFCQFTGRNLGVSIHVWQGGTKPVKPCLG